LTQDEDTEAETGLDGVDDRDVPYWSLHSPGCIPLSGSLGGTIRALKWQRVILDVPAVQVLERTLARDGHVLDESGARISRYTSHPRFRQA